MKSHNAIAFGIILGLSAGAGTAYAEGVAIDTGGAVGANVTVGADGVGLTADATADATGGATAATDPATPVPPLATATAPASDTPMTPPMANATELASADDLMGERVYDANGEWIGEISAVIPADVTAGATANAETRFIVDVGGFLGMGEKPVAIAASDLHIDYDADGDIEQVSVSFTEDQLEAMPTVEM